MAENNMMKTSEGVAAPTKCTVAQYWRSPPPDPCRVRVYDAERVQQLLQPEAGDRSSLRRGTTLSKTSGSRSEGLEAAIRAQVKAEKHRRLKEAEDQRLRNYERRREKATKWRAEAERLVREKIIEKQVKQEKRYNELRSDIAEGQKLAEEINKQLSLHEMNVRTKLTRQFDEWNRGVYGEIQQQINHKIEAMDQDGINRRRRNEFQKFLDTTNAKGAIFRDIIIESEYDPLEPNRNCIKYRSNHLRDPTKRILEKHYEETRMLEADTPGTKSRKAYKPKPPAVREMLSATEWNKIEATPHGYFARLTDDGRVRNARGSKTYSSHVSFDHYNVPVGHEVTNKEFRAGKRTFQAK